MAFVVGKQIGIAAIAVAVEVAVEVAVAVAEIVDIVDIVVGDPSHLSGNL